jgi:ElaB/YqjD/DUF883 family membrane-anchored ribosome-binding protein
MIKNIERTRDGMDSLIDKTRDAVVGAADRAAQGVETAAGRAVETAQQAGKSVRDGAEKAARGAHQRVQGTAQAVDRGYTRVRGDLTRVSAATAEYVAENPGKAILFAASAGFLIGMLLRRRRVA